MVSPEKVESSTPPGAVVTIVTIDPAFDDISSAEAIWGNFRHQVFSSDPALKRSGGGKESPTSPSYPSMTPMSWASEYSQICSRTLKNSKFSLDVNE